MNISAFLQGTGTVRSRKLMGAVLMLAAAVLAGCGAQPPRPEQPVVAAWERGEPLPLLSALAPMSLDQAYAIQRAAVLQRLGDRAPDGFKAGLTAAAGQRAFGVDQPVAGVLWPGSALDASNGELVLSAAGYRQPMLELELAFRVSTPITEPVADARALRERIDLVYPAIEVPDLDFASGKLTGADIVAGNVAASRYLLGRGQRADGVDINALFAQLRRDGESVQTADATAVMGNQWQALLWLVNRSVASGWTLQPGQMLLTGAMGPMLPLLPGHYLADYGELGRLEFTVEP